MIKAYTAQSKGARLEKVEPRYRMVLKRDYKLNRSVLQISHSREFPQRRLLLIPLRSVCD
jgi:hypothetical protein